MICDELSGLSGNPGSYFPYQLYCLFFAHIPAFGESGFGGRLWPEKAFFLMQPLLGSILQHLPTTSPCPLNDNKLGSVDLVD